MIIYTPYRQISLCNARSNFHEVALVLNHLSRRRVGLTPVLTLILNKELIVIVPICNYLKLSQLALFQPGRPIIYRVLGIAFQHMFTPGLITLKPEKMYRSVPFGSLG